jgi:hypothetical protein
VFCHELRVTLRLTVSQSVCLGIEPNLGQLTRVCFLLEISFRQLQVCNFVAPSLTRGRVCKLLYNCFWANSGVGVGVRLAADGQFVLVSGLPLGPMTRYFLIFSFDNYFVVVPRAPSLTRGRVCSLLCNHSLVRILMPNNHMNWFSDGEHSLACSYL